MLAKKVRYVSSAGKWSRVLNMSSFFLTDQTEHGDLTVEYFPTDSMLAD